MKYILHNYRRCPFCIRVRILLYLKGIAYETVEEPLREWTQWMKEWSSMTGERPRVPVLRSVSDEGAEITYTESNDIMRMLDRVHDDAQYAPDENSVGHAEMISWFLWCDDIFKHQIDRYKYGKDRKFDPIKHVEDVRVLREMVAKLESALERHDYLVEDRMTLTDIAIIPFVRQIMRTREGEFDFTDFPRTATWADTILGTPWFDEVVMKKLLAPSADPQPI